MLHQKKELAGRGYKVVEMNCLNKGLPTSIVVYGDTLSGVYEFLL